jgi:hypothetical protein
MCLAQDEEGAQGMKGGGAGWASVAFLQCNVSVSSSCQFAVQAKTEKESPLSSAQTSDPASEGQS